jgi:uncharacterized protein DUF1214
MATLQQEVSQPASSAGGMTPVGRRFTQYPLPAGPADGSLTIYVQSDAPADPAERANWLPAPRGQFSLYVRAYWPQEDVTNGAWTPPPVPCPQLKERS